MLFVAALIFAQPAAAAAATPGQKPTAKVECRLEREVGSRIPTKICRLDKEWELLAKDAQRVAEVLEELFHESRG